MTKKPHEIAPEDLENLKSHRQLIPHCIVNREEAFAYIATYKLKVNYLKELRDGTPRRLWELRDPKGASCGTLITAVGTDGIKNHDNYVRDGFDFMEILVDRTDVYHAKQIDPNSTISPRTSYFINKEIEENEKE